MNKVKIKLENCYGIKKMEEEFDFTRKPSFVIYAPNGVMKTSFARTFQDLSSGEESKDRVYEARDTIRTITDEDDNEISKEEIFVIEPYSQSYKSSKISTLLVNRALKEEYDQIHQGINEKKAVLLAELKPLSDLKENIIEETISETFTRSPKAFFETLVRVATKVEAEENSGLESISYKRIFSDKVIEFLRNPEFQENLKEYTQIYEHLISSSAYFKKGIFNHNNASVIAKNLKDNGFFKADHSISLNTKDGEEKKEITNEVELQKVIQQEMDSIFDDTDLALSFKAIDDKLKANQELRGFRDYLLENQTILPELGNIEQFKQKLWIAYLTKSITAFKLLMDEYNSGKKRIEEIIEQSKAEQTKWQDVILKSEAPNIKFEFKDHEDVSAIPINEKNLWHVLSNGEKRALYILNIIFEVEARKEANQKTLFVIDDIADSFDYKNKYAIIEYLKDISNEDIFYQIILSHNFDFYRTISSRLDLGRPNKLHTVKSRNSVRLVQEFYQNNPFNHWKEHLDNDEMLIASIPFFRNLAEYCGHIEDFTKLTSLLHIRTNTHQITIEDLVEIIKTILKDKDELVLGDSERKVIDVVYTLATSIVEEDDEVIELEKKIVLSIAIRLKAEEFLISKISDNVFVNGISSNQTFKLTKKYKELFPNEIAEIQVIDQVNLMTPENIHLNSFMYEPILDMSNEHLKQLYTTVSALNVNVVVAA